MKLTRYREWWRAVKAASGGTPTLILAAKMTLALMSGRVDVKTWRERIRTCGKCPIYRHATRTCGPRPGHIMGQPGEIGCGCYVPFSATTAAPYSGAGGKGCWGRAKFGGDFGWGEPQIPSSRSKANGSD